MTRDDAIRLLTNMKGYTHITLYEWLDVEKEALDMAIEALSADRPTGEWKEVYAETDYRNGWIEFSCECCGYQHGLESGEYGWSYGEPMR